MRYIDAKHIVRFFQHSMGVTFPRRHALYGHHEVFPLLHLASPYSLNLIVMIKASVAFLRNYSDGGKR